MAHESNQSKMPLACSPYWKWLSRTVQEVTPQDGQFTPTLFLVQNEKGDYRPIINLRALTGHSIWGAAISATAAAGLFTDLIVEAADWASVQTFERLYRRESFAGAFARVVLNG